MSELISSRKKKRKSLLAVCLWIHARLTATHDPWVPLPALSLVHVSSRWGSVARTCTCLDTIVFSILIALVLLGGEMCCVAMLVVCLLWMVYTLLVVTPHVWCSVYIPQCTVW